MNNMSQEFPYEDTSLCAGKFISLVRRESEKWPYEMVVRNNIKEIVAVFPITRDEEVLLIDEFRIPIWDRILSIPAGLADGVWEDLQEVARRELREETGYDSEHLTLAFTCVSSAGLSNESVCCFIAENCYKIGEQSLQGEEDIQVVPVPLDGLRAYLRDYEQTGKPIDTKLRALLSAYEDIKGERLF